MEPIIFFETWQRESAAIQKNLLRLKEPMDKNALDLWDNSGLLSIDWQNKRLWINVINHMTVSALLAQALAYRLTEAGISIMCKEVITASLIHDWSKRNEEEARENARLKNKDPTVAADIISQKASGKVNSLLGPIIASLYRVMGHEGIERASRRALTPEEKILLYTDCCVSDNKITTYKNRANKLRPHYEPGGRYEEATKWFKDKFGKTRQEKYDEIVLPIQEEFASILKVSPNLLSVAFAPPDLCEI